MGALEKCNNKVEVENVELEKEGRSETVAIEDAVKVLLQALGDDINREGIRKTPLRVAKALQDATRGYNQDVNEIVCGALFPEAGLESSVGSAGGVGGLVIVRDLDMFSYCESCLVPFQVKCHVGYIPSDERVVGLSKLSRVSEVFAKRLQHPHRLADEICAALQETIRPTGVAVVLHCSHINPNHQESVKLSVISGSGVFDDDKANDIWTDFLGLLRFNLKDVSDSSLDKSWCPAHEVMCKSKIADSNLVAAVSSILTSLGEDPLRKDLVGTPARFINWMMNFKSATDIDIDMKLQPSIFSSGGGEEQVICYELNLPFWSQCEHHLLPFHGVVHVGYYSSNRVNSVGKSLVQSIVHFYGFKLQVQERLTRQIAEVVATVLGEDIIVVVEATHTCMISRGIQKIGSSTSTIAVLGRFSTDTTARAKFLQILPNTSF